MCYVDDDCNWQCDLGFKVQGDKLTTQHHQYVKILQLKKNNLFNEFHTTLFFFSFWWFFANKKGW